MPVLHSAGLESEVEERGFKEKERQMKKGRWSDQGHLGNFQEDHREPKTFRKLKMSVSKKLRAGGDLRKGILVLVAK